MAQKVKFMTISNQRTGSSYFQRLLNSHPDITARQEDLRVRRTDLSTFLDTLYSSGSSKVFGFKVQNVHIDNEVVNYIKAHDIRVIQLIRNDLLETALWYKSHFEGEAEGGGGSPLIIKGLVKANIDRVLNHMEWIRDQYNKYKPLAGIVITYEDFTNGTYYNKEVMNKVLEFLEVDIVDLGDEQRKNKRAKSESIVENWNDLINEMERRNINRYYFED